MKSKVFIISDATGDTAQKVVSAALKQFDASVSVEIFPQVRSEEDIEKIVERAVTDDVLLVHTVVNPAHRQFLETLCEKAEVSAVDLMGALITKLGQFLESEAHSQPGGLHAVDAEYFRRIEAVEFAVSNDDGQHPRNLHKADIVLVGISRTSKTPLSTYLAQRGYKVANIPLVLGIEPPTELFEIDQAKIVALSIETVALFRIRQARLQSLGMPSDTSYGMREHIEKESRYARQFFDAHPHWPVINITDRAIEETAAELLSIRKKMQEKA